MLNMIRIGPRLALTFVVGLGLLAFTTLMSLREMRAINEKTQFFSEHIVPSLKIQHSVALEFSAIRRAEVRHVLSDSVNEMAELEKQISATRNAIDALLVDYSNHYVTDAEDRAGLDKTRALLSAHDAALAELLTASRLKTRSNKAQETASALLKGETLRSYEAVQKGLDSWWAHNLALSDMMTTTAMLTYERTQQLLLGMLVSFLAVGALGAWLITRSVVKPIQMAVEAAQAAAEGDLTREPHIRGKDEATHLLNVIRRMNDGLSSIVREVREASESLLNGSSEVARDSADLSRRTEHQAVSLEETSVSVVQIQAAMQRNADSARQSAHLTSTACQTAREGNDMIHQLNSRMGQIVSNTKQITEIIGMIDALSFQINLLALNASVEAARAGESGKGFAVVASEVRSLAQRSAESAGEIRNKIRTCVDDMQSGAVLVESVSASMGTIVTQISQASDFVKEISDTVAEQSESFNQVTIAVKSLQNMTEDNVTLVDQGAASAHNLKNQAETLRRAVSRFRLTPTTRNAAPKTSLKRATAGLAAA